MLPNSTWVFESVITHSKEQSDYYLFEH